MPYAASLSSNDLPLRSLSLLVAILVVATFGLVVASVLLPHVPFIFFILSLIPLTALLLRLGLQGSHQAALLRWLRLALGTASDEATSAPMTPKYGVGWGWLLGGLLLLGIALAGLELMQPYYFTQDDNLIYNVPIAVSCHSLEMGVFPTWNPYQLLGEPTSNQSGYMLTYPLVYGCCFIARYALGQPYAFTDVFCILHLLLGYGATYWAARALGLRPSLAMLAALSYTLSGCALIMGRSYFHMTPVLAYMSLLVVCVVWLQKGPVTWHWALFTGCVIGLACHSGNGQMWTYEVCYFLLAVALLLAARAIRPRAAGWVLAALLLGLAIGAPLIVPQAAFMAGLPRVGGYGGGIRQGLLAMLLPYPFTSAAHPNKWGSTDLQYMGEFYYSGTLFVAVTWLALLAGLGWVFACKCDSKLLRVLVARNVWLICAGITFDLAMGPEGILWPLSSVLPLFKWFTGPFKFLLFLNLFMALGAGLVVERMLRSTPQRQRWEGGLAVGVVALLLYHAALARPSFYTYADKPYPTLPRAMRDLLSFSGRGTPQRIMPFAPERSTAPGYLLSLKHALPTVYGVVSVEGYNPFVAITPPNRLANAAFIRDPVAAARAYGVRWIVEHRLTAHPILGPNPSLHTIERVSPNHLRMLNLLKRQAHQELTLPDVTIWELTGSSPLAFATAQPAQALPLHYSQAGVDVDTTRLPAGGRVVINDLLRPEMQAKADGQPLSLGADNWGRIVVAVPRGTKQLTVRYVPPWAKGFWCSIALAALASLIMVLLSLGEQRAEVG